MHLSGYHVEWFNSEKTAKENKVAESEKTLATIPDKLQVSSVAASSVKEEFVHTISSDSTAVVQQNPVPQILLTTSAKLLQKLEKAKHTQQILKQNVSAKEVKSASVVGTIFKIILVILLIIFVLALLALVIAISMGITQISEL